MKSLARSPKSRAQLCEKLLAYSAASAAALGAAPSADAQTALDADYFGGTLPSLSFNKTDQGWRDTAFSVGNGQLIFRGNHGFAFFSSESYTAGGIALLNVGGFANIQLNGNQVGSSLYLFSTYQGNKRFNLLGGTAANLNCTTTAGGHGILPLKLAWGGGNISLSVDNGGTFTSASAVPEPADVAAGLGLLALGFAGIREHRRRRTAATTSPTKA